MGINVKNLSYTYHQDTVFARQALKNVSFSVKDGEFVGILGASGSGKSTLIQHLNGVIPSKDKVEVNGTLIGDKSVSNRDIVSKAAMAFQYPEHQILCDTVEEEIGFGCRNLGYDEEKTAELVAEAAEYFCLGKEYMPRSPFQLSGGEKRRVALASIFAMDTPILLLDEPTVALDLKGKADFMTMMQKTKKERNKTILWIGHDLEEIAKVATRLIVMNQGKIILDGKTADVLQEVDTLKKCGIDTFENKSLIRQMREHFGDSLDTEDGKKIMDYLFDSGGDEL